MICKLVNYSWKLFFNSCFDSRFSWFFVMIFQHNIVFNSRSIFTQTTHVFNLLDKFWSEEFILNTFIKKWTWSIMNASKVFKFLLFLVVSLFLLHDVLLLWIPLKLLSLNIFKHELRFRKTNIIRKHFWISVIKSDYFW